MNNMKKILIILLLIPLSLTAQIKPDKYYHAGAGTLLSSGMYTIGQFSNREMNPIAPSLIAFSGGCAKEFFDSYNGGHFSYNDVLWTTASGIVTNLIISKIWKPKKRTIQIEDEFNPPLVKK